MTMRSPYTESLGREIELIEPGRLVFSGPVKKRPALESLLLKNSFHLVQPRELPDGTLPRPGHGLPSYTDPIAAAKAGAPNSGHAPGSAHPAELDFYVKPKKGEPQDVHRTERRPNPLTEHVGKPYEDDPGITFVTCEWARPQQIHEARFIAEGCGWILRSVTTQGKLLLQDEPEHPSIMAVKRELDVLREIADLPPRMEGGVANSPAWAMQAGSHSAQLARQANTAIYNPLGGVIHSGDYAVTQNGTPNMSVNIAGGVPGGQILVPRTGTGFAGLYYGYNDATVNMTGFTAPPANTWISTVFAQAEDAAYSDASTVFQLGFVTGTAAGSPVAPTLAVSAMALANIAIASTTTSITTGLITSKTFLAQPQVGSGYLIGKHIYAPGSNTGLTISTSGGVLDTNNLTVSFTAPSSGAVTVRLTGFLVSVANAAVAWGLVTHGTTTQVGYGGEVMSEGSNGGNNMYFTTDLEVVGLTPSTAYQLDWAANASTTGCSVFAGPGNTITPTGVPPAILKVYSA